MANQSKFIFTEEGKTLLVSQNGGVKFAILGFLPVEGLAGDANEPDAVCKNGLSARWNEIENSAKNAGVSVMQYIVDNNLVTFIFKDVEYSYKNESLIEPVDQVEYNNAILDYVKHLYGTFYTPSTELVSDKDNKYGTYSLYFDRTKLKCNIDNTGTGFNLRHVILIGKQYSEDSNAVFNINERQDASIVGVVEICQDTGYGIQILASQNNFVSFQCQLRFTVVDCDNDDITEVVIQDNDKYSPIADIANKLALVNNGVKTLKGGLSIAQDKPILDELSIGNDGAIAMTRTLTVVDAISEMDTDNQFNGASMIHSINKYDPDIEFKPNLLMTSINEDEDDKPTSTVGLTVRAKNGNNEASFSIGSIPETEKIAVDIFGADNQITDNAHAKMIFSDNNNISGIDQDSTTTTDNLLFGSHHNSVYDTNENVLIHANYNELSGCGKHNTLISTTANNLHSTATQNLICNSYTNYISGSYNSLNTSHSNYIKSDANNLVNNSNVNGISANSKYNSLNYAQSNNISGSCNILQQSSANNINGFGNIAIVSHANTVTDNSTYNILLDSNANNISVATANFLVNANNSKIINAYNNWIFDHINEIKSDSSKCGERAEYNFIVKSYSNLNKPQDTLMMYSNSVSADTLDCASIINSNSGKIVSGSHIDISNSNGYRISGTESIYSAGLYFGMENINEGDLNLSLYKSNTYSDHTSVTAADGTNQTLMKTNNRPRNSLMLGGNHNQLVGGMNSIMLGGTYTKASTYANQVVMGKFNKDVPADVIYGCGNFTGSYTVNGKTYNNENSISSMPIVYNDDAIGDIRNRSTLQNAYEFYAHQGKIVLQNCDDGKDSGTQASEHYKKTVTIDPTGIIFKDENGKETGKLDPNVIIRQDNLNGKVWNICIDYDNAITGYKVISTEGIPDELSITFDDIFTDISDNYYTRNAQTLYELSDDEIDKLYDNSQKIFSTEIPNEINITFKQIIKSADILPITFLNNLCPWVINGENNLPALLTNNKINLNYYCIDGSGYINIFNAKTLKDEDTGNTCVKEKNIPNSGNDLDKQLFRLDRYQNIKLTAQSFGKNYCTGWTYNGNPIKQFVYSYPGYQNSSYTTKLYTVEIEPSDEINGTLTIKLPESVSGIAILPILFGQSLDINDDDNWTSGGFSYDITGTADSFVTIPFHWRTPHHKPFVAIGIKGNAGIDQTGILEKSINYTRIR